MSSHQTLTQNICRHLRIHPTTQQLEAMIDVGVADQKLFRYGDVWPHLMTGLDRMPAPLKPVRYESNRPQLQLYYDLQQLQPLRQTLQLPISLEQTCQLLQPLATCIDELHKKHRVVAFDLELDHLFINDHQEVIPLGAFWVPTTVDWKHIRINSPLRSYAAKVTDVWTPSNRPAANIYAVALIAYELLCGCLPWEQPDISLSDLQEGKSYAAAHHNSHLARAGQHKQTIQTRFLRHYTGEWKDLHKVFAIFSKTWEADRNRHVPTCMALVKRLQQAAIVQEKPLQQEQPPPSPSQSKTPVEKSSPAPSFYKKANFRKRPPSPVKESSSPIPSFHKQSSPSFTKKKSSTGNVFGKEQHPTPEPKASHHEEKPQQEATDIATLFLSLPLTAWKDMFADSRSDYAKIVQIEKHLETDFIDEWQTLKSTKYHLARSWIESHLYPMLDRLIQIYSSICWQAHETNTVQVNEQKQLLEVFLGMSPQEKGPLVDFFESYNWFQPIKVRPLETEVVTNSEEDTRFHIAGSHPVQQVDLLGLVHSILRYGLESFDKQFVFQPAMVVICGQ